MPTIKFINEKKTVEVPEGANLRKAALRENIPLYKAPSTVLNCHGFGHCGSCRVLIKKGRENVSRQGWFEKLRLIVGPLTFFYRLGRENELRLACRTRVYGDVEVETRPSMNLHGEKFWG
jgi:ferredoxin